MNYATDLNLDFVRAQFPAFNEPALAGFAHFENAGGSYACPQTIVWLDRYYRETKIQPYYAFGPSTKAGGQMDAAKERMAAWLNVGADEIQIQISRIVHSRIIPRPSPGDAACRLIAGAPE